MTQVTMEFNPDGFRELLTGSEIQQVIDAERNRIHAKCGEGYETHSFIGWRGSRYIGVVGTGDYASRKDQAENKTLQRALGC